MQTVFEALSIVRKYGISKGLDYLRKLLLPPNELYELSEKIQIKTTGTWNKSTNLVSLLCKANTLSQHIHNTELGLSQQG